MLTFIERTQSARYSEPSESSVLVNPVPRRLFRVLSTRHCAATAPYVGLTLSLEELKQMQSNTVDLEINSEEFRYWSRQVRGAATVMGRGERNLRKIEAAERQFNSLP